MTNEKSSILSVDVVYLIFMMLMILCFLNAKSGIDILFLVVTTVYYIRIKIYRWKKYH